MDMRSEGIRKGDQAPGEAETKVYGGGSSGKKMIDSGVSQLDNIPSMNGLNEIVAHQPGPVSDFLNENFPPDTPGVTVRISKNCQDLLSQAAHLASRLEIPCDKPVDLMVRITRMSQRYQNMEKYLAKERETELKNKGAGHPLTSGGAAG